MQDAAPTRPYHDTPSDAVKAAWDAILRDDWLAVARCCDPDSLAAFQIDELLQVAPPPPELIATLEEAIRGTPGISREMAEVHLSSLAELREPARRLSKRMPLIATIDEGRALSPEEFFARILEGQSTRFVMRRALSTGEVTEGQAAEATAAAASPPFRVLGEAPDGDAFAWVFFRANQPIRDAEEDERYLAQYPAGARALRKEVDSRHGMHTILAHRRSDGSWGIIAGLPFLGQGMFRNAVGLTEIGSREEDGDA